MRNSLLIAFLMASVLSHAQTFTLKSNELGGQATAAQVLNGFGCHGGNRSPQLFWENAPAGTESYAVTIYDADATTGSGWWHWIIFDIDKSYTELATDAGNVHKSIAPANAIQGKTDFGVPGYGGPCPPQGSRAHKYLITVYALKTGKLGLDANATAAMVGFYLEQNAIEKASLVFYCRQ